MTTLYEVRIQGSLPEGWSDCFTGLEIRSGPHGETTLTGCLPDQAALLGLLNRLQAWNITLLSFERRRMVGTWVDNREYQAGG